MIFTVLTSELTTAVNFADVYYLFARIFFAVEETDGRCCGYYV